MLYPRRRLKPLLLAVDDDEMQRFLYRKALEPTGIEIIEARDGETAIALFIEVRPDLVLLDAQMPGMNGFDTCQYPRVLIKDT